MNTLLTAINIGIALLNFIMVNIIAERQKAYSKNYTDLDKAYDDLLKQANDNPEFRDPIFAHNYSEYKKVGEKEYRLALQYEIYAFRCMNFCETLYDTCSTKLLKTWACIIKSESKLHSTWFNEAENQERFKETFKYYIRNDCKKPVTI
jgi:hypothetical protein